MSGAQPQLTMTYSTTIWPATELAKPRVTMRDMIGRWCVTLRFGRDQITLHLTPAQMEDLCSEWQLEARKAESTDFGKRGAK